MTRKPFFAMGAISCAAFSLSACAAAPNAAPAPAVRPVSAPAKVPGVVPKLQANGLPEGWVSQYVGPPALNGKVEYEPDRTEFVIGGSSGDIGSSGDNFYFSGKTLNGDGALIAHLQSGPKYVDQWAKTGLVIRESLEPGARNAAILVTPIHGSLFQWRAQNGGETASAAGEGKEGVWLKIERVGNIFTGSVSPDGKAWKVVGTQTLTMPTKTQIGLAWSTKDRGVQNSAIYSKIRLRENGRETALAPRPPRVYPKLPPLPAGAIKDLAAIGMNGGDPDMHRHLELGMGSARDGVNEKPGDPVFQQRLDMRNKLGIATHAVIGPRWNVDRGNSDSAKDDMKEWYANWEKWCRAHMTANKGRLFYYILDNEPDLPGPTNNMFTPAQAVEFTRIMFTVARQVDPKIQIESSPISSVSSAYLPEMLAKGVGNYCDFIGIHAYGGQINDGTFDAPWRAMEKYGVYKPVVISEAGVAATWGRNNIPEDGQQWRGNWHVLYYPQLKRYGYAQTQLFGLHDKGDGDFSFVDSVSDTPIQPSFDIVKYGYARQNFANGDFESPNVAFRDWVTIHIADTRGPAPTSVFTNDATKARDGKGFVLQRNADGQTPKLRRIAANLKPGFAYTITGYAFIEGAGKATLAAQGFDIVDGDREACATTEKSGAWQKLSVRVVPSASWIVVSLESELSGENAVRWDDVSISSTRLPQKPAAPQGLALSRRAATTTLSPLASLSWKPVPEAAYYSIYRATTPNGAFVKIHDNVLGTPFSLLENRGAKPVFYRVTATNAAGESAPSVVR